MFSSQPNDQYPHIKYINYLIYVWTGCDMSVNWARDTNHPKQCLIVPTLQSGAPTLTIYHQQHLHAEVDFDSVLSSSSRHPLVSR
jgi:hypothetical protein